MTTSSKKVDPKTFIKDRIDNCCSYAIDLVRMAPSELRKVYKENLTLKFYQKPNYDSIIRAFEDGYEKELSMV